MVCTNFEEVADSVYGCADHWIFLTREVSLVAFSYAVTNVCLYHWVTGLGRTSNIPRDACIRTRVARGWRINWEHVNAIEAAIGLAHTTSRVYPIKMWSDCAAVSLRGCFAEQSQLATVAASPATPALTDIMIHRQWPRKMVSLDGQSGVINYSLGVAARSL